MDAATRSSNRAARRPAGSRSALGTGSGARALTESQVKVLILRCFQRRGPVKYHGV
jgi:hypothetical protein